jgi:hypothetical protein
VLRVQRLLLLFLRQSLQGCVMRRYYILEDKETSVIENSKETRSRGYCSVLSIACALHG